MEYSNLHEEYVNVYKISQKLSDEGTNLDVDKLKLEASLKE